MDLSHIDSEFGRTWVVARHGRGTYIPVSYIDINSGNANDARMFAQIIYWFAPSEDGKRKLTIFQEGYWWLRKAHSEWFGEIRMKARTARDCLNRLKARRLVITKKVVDRSGSEAIYIRINWPEFERRIKLWQDSNIQAENEFTALEKQIDYPHLEVLQKAEPEQMQVTFRTWDDAAKLTINQGLYACMGQGASVVVKGEQGEMTVSLLDVESVSPIEKQPDPLTDSTSPHDVFHTPPDGKRHPPLTENVTPPDGKRHLHILHSRVPKRVRTRVQKTTSLSPVGDEAINPILLWLMLATKPAPKPKHSDMLSAVCEAYKLKPGAYASMLANFFQGKIGKKQKDSKWDQYKLDDEPANPLEVVGFALWWDAEYEEMSLPSAPETLYTRFMEFRGHDRYRDALDYARDRWHQLMGITVGKPQTDDDVDPNAAEIVDQMMADLDKVWEESMRRALGDDWQQQS
ncbi:MAG: hypothetical protein OHK0046_47560 [Anaerolineae bacterium]